MIKRIIAAGLIVFGAAAAASAQGVTVDTNITLGLNVSRFQASDLQVKFSLKAGFTGGAQWSVYFTDFFGLQSGLLYSQKGGIYNVTVSDGTLRNMLAFSYLEFPLVAKLGYLPRENVAFRIYALGGMSYGLKLSSRAILDLVQQGIETPLGDTKLDGYKPGVFTGIAGVGFEFAVKGGGQFFFEGRYSKSLTTVSSEGVDHRFTVLTFMAGYSF
jgi:hypothetical protein